MTKYAAESENTASSEVYRDFVKPTMKSKFVVNGVLSLITLVIMFVQRKSYAQHLPDAMENMHLLSSATRYQTASRRLMTTSPEFPDFKMFVNTFDILWSNKSMEESESDSATKNSSACARDLAEWRRGIFRQDVWALSCEYAD